MMETNTFIPSAIKHHIDFITSKGVEYYQIPTQQIFQPDPDQSIKPLYSKHSTTLD